MKITYRHYSAEEAWHYIITRYNNYWRRNMAQYGYRGDMWLPTWENLISAFENPDKNIILSLKKYFIENYNEKHLTKHDEFIKSNVIPDLEIFAESFGKIMVSQGIFVPEMCEIFSSYGFGASYCYENGQSGIILRTSRMSQDRILLSTKHEFVHTLIEVPIIEKYKVPQDIKECIVDIICELYFNKPVQGFPVLDFVRRYINKKSIETNLAGTVKGMMIDYRKQQNLQAGAKNIKKAQN